MFLYRLPGPWVLAVLLFASVAPSAQAAGLADDPRVADAVGLWSEWAEYQAGTERVPAVSFGIVHDQELIASGAFGEANPAEGVPATTETLYSICSISKLFTSIALMQQREAGNVRLDGAVADYLDWFDIEDAHPDDEMITVRRLLTHSSGLALFPVFQPRSDPGRRHRRSGFRTDLRRNVARAAAGSAGHGRHVYRHPDRLARRAARHRPHGAKARRNARRRSRLSTLAATRPQAHRTGTNRTAAGSSRLAQSSQ